MQIKTVKITLIAALILPVLAFTACDVIENPESIKYSGTEKNRKTDDKTDRPQTVTKDSGIELLRKGARKELYENILPFWLDHSYDTENGGFIGSMTNNLQIDKEAPKGLVLNTRILWTFSAAYRLRKDEKYIRAADRAFRYLVEHFRDIEEGGYYWMVDYVGKPLEDKKELYGLSFVIYSLSEYYLATGSTEALNRARDLFELIETKCYDKVNRGYYESFSRNWEPFETSTLAYGVEGGVKTMNTHLHLLEAYTNLYRAWPDGHVKGALTELLLIFIEDIIDPDNFYCRLFFDEQWNSLNQTVSFGHDIEAVWLLSDAAEAVKNRKLIALTRKIGQQIAYEVYRQGLDIDGALLYEAENGVITRANKDWWPQAEAVVGFIHTWQINKNSRYLDAAVKCWQFTTDNIVDQANGEWFISAEAADNPDAHKISAWKAPYHNGRACMEIIKRLN